MELKKNTKIRSLNMISMFMFFMFLSSLSFAQTKEYKIASVAFYNVENLFDTINNTELLGSDFTPDGPKVWNTDKYYKKLNKTASVISKLGDKYIKGGPSVIGISEIENITVLQDLINMPQLKDSKYKIVHYDSPDRRGIDVALLYREDFFTVTSSSVKKFHIEGNDKFVSRDQLLVTGLLDGEEISFIVNHWPSRRGGEKRSLPGRIRAAEMAREVVDSLHKINSDAKIIIMGDFNDNPSDPSIFKHLGAKGDKDKLKEGELFNPMYNKFKKGYGSNAYRDTWSLFDNLIVSQGLLGDDKTNYKYWKTIIYSENYLKQKEGKYEGYPLRTFSGDTFKNGYSDHFPVYLYLIKEK